VECDDGWKPAISTRRHKSAVGKEEVWSELVEEIWQKELSPEHSPESGWKESGKSGRKSETGEDVDPVKSDIVAPQGCFELVEITTVNDYKLISRRGGRKLTDQLF
jgi:hypothetical protein